MAQVTVIRCDICEKDVGDKSNPPKIDVDLTAVFGPSNVSGRVSVMLTASEEGKILKDVCGPCRDKLIKSLLAKGVSYVLPPAPVNQIS